MTDIADQDHFTGFSEGKGRTETDLANERILAFSTPMTKEQYKTSFVVPDMHCAGCIGKIERALTELAGVVHVRANLTLKTVSVIWSAGHCDGIAISRTLKRLGFEHHLAETDLGYARHDQTGRGLLLALAVAGFAAANIMLLSVSVWSGADKETTQLFHLISGLIAIPTVFFSGQPFFRSAAKALRASRLNMDVPISLAVLLALGMSLYESLQGGEEAYFDASVTLIFFLLIGRYLDHLMREKARGAVERLSSLSAKDGVHVGEDGSVSHIALKEIAKGMRLRIYPGERFPVNSQILAGKSDLDRSHVTGESDPMLAQIGDVIEAGTLNLTASVEVVALGTCEDSFLSEMHGMMTAAEEGRGAYVRIADRMARIYAPAVHILAFVTFLGWMFVSDGDWHTAVYTAIAVLIVTCPCALGLAVPVAHVIGAHRLLQNGILMRNGSGLERLAEVDNVIFDKTGTLTKGMPIVSGAVGLKSSDRNLVGTLAKTSRHPVAKAIDEYLCNTSDIVLDWIEELPGLGIEGQVRGRKLRLGKPEWVAAIAKDIPKEAPDGMSAAFAVQGDFAALFMIDDETREGAIDAVKALHTDGISVEIVSGDNAVKVAALANFLNVETWLAGQSPSGKIAHIDAKRECGQHTLMVGDGINDAPALAGGHVSMVPATGSDIGRHAADFVFTRKSLLAVPIAITTARDTDRIVKQNFGLAIAYNCIAVPLAMAGFVTPLVAAIAMSASSIAVVANSFRIMLAPDIFGQKARVSTPENNEQYEVLA